MKGRKGDAICDNGHLFLNVGIVEIDDEKYFGIIIPGRKEKVWQQCPICKALLHEKPTPGDETVTS